MRRSFWVVVVWASGCGWALGGGESSEAGDDLRVYCEAAEDCADGAFDQTVDACVDGMEDLRQEASLLGCGELFRTYMSCLTDNPTCSGQEVSLSGCVSEVEAFAECFREGEPSDIGDSGFTYASYTHTSDTAVETLPPGHRLLPTVGCADGELEVTLDYLAADGIEAVFDAVDTANAPDHWYETHYIPWVGSADGVTSFQANLRTSTDYINGVGSAFSCDPGVHFEEAPLNSVMTYVFRVYDAGGLADCMVIGNFPFGIFEGVYDTYGNTVLPEDINRDNCAEGGWVR